MIQFALKNNRFPKYSIIKVRCRHFCDSFYMLS